MESFFRFAAERFFTALTIPPQQGTHAYNSYTLNLILLYNCRQFICVIPFTNLGTSNEADFLFIKSARQNFHKQMQYNQLQLINLIDESKGALTGTNFICTGHCCN